MLGASVAMRIVVMFMIMVVLVFVIVMCMSIGMVVRMFMVVRMLMPVRMAMTVSMAMSVVRMSKDRQADDVDEETKDADNQQLIQPLQLISLVQTMDGVKDNLYTHKATIR
jgi:hypothetical protein